MTPRCPDCSGGGFELTIAGRVVGVCGLCDGTGVLPVCPNLDDPVLCAYHPDLQTFVPECGCPVHDPDERKLA